MKYNNRLSLVLKEIKIQIQNYNHKMKNVTLIQNSR